MRSSVRCSVAREDLGQLGLLDVGGGGAREVPDGRRPSGVEPGDDGGVVGGGVGEGGPGEPATRRRRERAGGAQLLEHGGVVGRRRDDADVLVVLGRRPHHGRAADVDELDGGVGGERVEVRHHQVDGIDAVGRQVVEVLGLGAVGEDAAVDLGVEGLDPPAEHLGRAGHLRHLGVGDARLAQLGRGVAAGDQLPAQVGEALGQLDQALLVVHRQQGPHDVISSSLLLTLSRSSSRLLHDSRRRQASGPAVRSPVPLRAPPAPRPPWPGRAGARPP